MLFHHQNRLPVTAIDSDDSGSDWDSTVAADLPRNSQAQSTPRQTHDPRPPHDPQVKTQVANNISSQIEGDYATVTPRPRTSLQGQILFDVFIVPHLWDKLIFYFYFYL